MIGFAPAKINLHLHVTGRRADGYHLLDSLVAFADVGDVVEAVAGEGLSLALDGPFADGLGAGADNLVLRAAVRLAEAAGVRPDAALRLTKRLPIASGIGGGSADAAAALRVLVRLWGIAPDADMLARLAQGLGADVPVCLARRPALMRGVGEVLADVPALPTFGLLLVNPGVGVSTAAVFGARSAAASAACTLPAGWPDLPDLVAWLEQCRNDLEAPARRLCGAVGDVLEAIRTLPGCRLARMSGSGATCFGVFDDAAAARHGADLLGGRRWWVHAGMLAGAPAEAPPSRSATAMCLG